MESSEWRAEPNEAPLESEAEKRATHDSSVAPFCWCATICLISLLQSRAIAPI